MLVAIIILKTLKSILGSRRKLVFSEEKSKKISLNRVQINNNNVWSIGSFPIFNKKKYYGVFNVGVLCWSWD